jgi:hypothetical protein
MVVHNLKLWPQFWVTTTNAIRSFDIRNNDREFEIGDVIRFQEWEPSTRQYTGRECYREITYVLRARDCPAKAITEGYVALAIIPWEN